MKKLQKMALSEVMDNISSTKTEIYQIDYRIKELKTRIREVRSIDETYRADPNLLELDDLIFKLIGDLSADKLIKADNWLKNLDEE